MPNIVITTGSTTVADVDGTIVQWTSADTVSAEGNNIINVVGSTGTPILSCFISDIVSIDGAKPYGNAGDVVLQITNESSGGGGLAMESYQNSAMSTPVQAYVFRDSEDNIMRVYEPERNNDVSRYEFSYAESIDKFPFDNEDWFNNTVQDAKLVDLGEGSVVQSCTLNDVVFKMNDNILTIINTNWKGNYGNKISGVPHEEGAELYMLGNASIKGGTLKIGACIEYLGGLDLKDCSEIGEGVFIVGWDESSNLTLVDCHFTKFSALYFDADIATANCTDCWLGLSAEIYFKTTGLQALACKIEQGGTLNIETNNAAHVSIGQDATVSSSSGVLSGNRYIEIGGTTYELGVSGGNVTATAL